MNTLQSIAPLLHDLATCADVPRETHATSTLVHIDTRKPVCSGDVITDFRGATSILQGAHPRCGANGMVMVRGREYYPSVYNLVFICST